MDDVVRRNAMTSLPSLLTFSLGTCPLLAALAEELSKFAYIQRSLPPGHRVGQRRDENGSGGEFLAQMPAKVWL